MLLLAFGKHNTVYCGLLCLSAVVFRSTIVCSYAALQWKLAQCYFKRNGFFLFFLSFIKSFIQTLSSFLELFFFLHCECCMTQPQDELYKISISWKIDNCLFFSHQNDELSVFCFCLFYINAVTFFKSLLMYFLLGIV